MSKDIPWIEFDQEKAAAGHHVRLKYTSLRFHYVGTNASGDHVLHSISGDGNHGAPFFMAKHNECLLGLWPKTKRIWVAVVWRDGTCSLYGDTKESAQRNVESAGFSLSQIVVCQECEVLE